MKKILKKLNKISLPVVILIASFILGGFFYASEANKQRSIERQQQIKIEQERQDLLTKELKEKQAKEENEQALFTCISHAKSNYSDMWFRECKAQGKLTNKCIDINELSFDEYLKKYGLSLEDYVKERELKPNDPNSSASINLSATLDYIIRKSDECSCRLLTSTADRFNESLEKDKAECYIRYPQK